MLFYRGGAKFLTVKPKEGRWTLNIHAHRGTKVVFSHPDAGYPHDQETARKHLKVGKKYTIKRTKVHSFHTDVFLQEVPEVSFNSVHFTEA